MQENQVVPIQRQEEKKDKGTNWYLVGGVAFAAGIALFAVGAVVMTRRKKMALYEFEGQEIGAEWTDESYLNEFFSTTQSTFKRMWGSAMSSLKKVNEVVRSRLGAGETFQPLASKEEIDAKSELMDKDDNNFFVDGDF